MNKEQLINSFHYGEICKKLTINEQSEFNNLIQNSDCSFKLEFNLSSNNKKIILKIPIEFLNNLENKILHKIE